MRFIDDKYVVRTSIFTKSLNGIRSAVAAKFPHEMYSSSCVTAKLPELSKANTLFARSVADNVNVAPETLPVDA